MKTALVGLGRIGWSLELDRLRYHPCTHAGTLRKLSGGTPSFSLDVACDRNPEQLSKFRKWWPARSEIKGYTSHEEALAVPGLEAAVIAVSLADHREVAEVAIRRGIPRLLIEKPVATTAAEARGLDELARTMRCSVWVNFERRYHPAYQWAKQVIQEESLGTLRSIRGLVLTGEPKPGTTAGPLLHDAIHWIDLLLWYAGKPTRVSASVKRLGRGEQDHTVFARMDYADFSATLESGGRRNYFEFQMELDFSDGRIIIGNNGLQAWRAKPSRRYEGFRELRQWSPRIRRANPWLALYGEILAHDARDGRTRAAPPSAGLADAVLGLEIVETILGSGA